MQEGFVKIYRKIIENPIFKNPGLLQLYIYCILRANFKDNEFIFNGKLEKVKKGSFITGRNELSKELNVNKNTIYKRLQILKDLSYINIYPNNKYSLIEIINYEKNQSQNYRKNLTEMPIIKGDVKNTSKSNNKNLAEMPIDKGFKKTKKGNGNNKRTTKEQRNNTNKNDKNDKKNYYRNSVVNLFRIITGKELSYCYAIINKMLKCKEQDTEISNLQKYLMLMYVIKNNREKINENKYIGILINQYRELSYKDFKVNVFEQRQQLSICHPGDGGYLN